MILKYVRRTFIAAFLACGAVLTNSALASNSAMLELLEVLYKNGTIDDATYGLLRNSAMADAERTHAKIEETAENKVAAVKQTSDKLKWAEKIKLKGDLRLRRQYQKADPEIGKSSSRERYRYRLRLGANAQVNDQVKVGLGFASGKDDARSTNETLDGGFSTKDIRLDYAFAEWTPGDWGSVVGGKFKRKPYLWAPTDMLWDGDVNPEGLSVHLHMKNSLGTAYGNAGHWLLEENKSVSDDPTLTYAQLGHKFKFGNMFAHLAGTYYAFDGMKEAGVIGKRKGYNTLTATDKYMFDYDALGLSAEVGVQDVWLPGKMFAVFTDYVKNDDSNEDRGVAFGFKFGDRKVSNRHTWQFKYINADLEADAFPDFLPDSDRLGGNTGVQSNEFVFQYAIAKNIILALDYYDSERNVPGKTDDEEKLFQSDISFKF